MVPILVVSGKLIKESAVIMQYLDDNYGNKG